MALEVPAALEAKIDEVITHYPVSKRSAVLPLLHLMQHEYRYITDDAVNWVAAKLGLQPIQVLEVVTFYPAFARAPRASSTSASAARSPAPWLAAMS